MKTKKTSSQSEDDEKERRLRVKITSALTRLRLLTGKSYSEFGRLFGRTKNGAFDLTAGHYVLTPETAMKLSWATGVDQASLLNGELRSVRDGKAYTKKDYEEWSTKATLTADECEKIARAFGENFRIILQRSEGGKQLVLARHAAVTITDEVENFLNPKLVHLFAVNGVPAKPAEVLRKGNTDERKK